METETGDPYEDELSARERLRQRNKQSSTNLLEQGLAGAATASGTASPEQAAQASQATGIPQGFSGAQGNPLSALQPLTGIGGAPGPINVGSPGDSQLYQNVAQREIGDGGSGETLSPSSIASVASQAGFQGEDLVKAVAVAMAESRGNPRGIGDQNLTTQGEQSTGLWQINFRPGRDEGDPTRDPQRNLDPKTNAANAKKILDEQGWGAWSVTHGTPDTNNNHYSRFLDQARQAVGQLGGR